MERLAAAKRPLSPITSKGEIMGSIRKTLTMSLLAAGAATLAFAATPANAQCAAGGNCGVDVGNGNVTNSPGFALSGGAAGSYNWVSTANSTATGAYPGVIDVNGAGGVVNTTNGSTDTINIGALGAGQGKTLYFNFVTSDGNNPANIVNGSGGFPDYGWATMTNTTTGQSYLIFSALTNANPPTAPGAGFPTIDASSTFAPTNLIGGAPTWSELGGSSGTCYDTGCGYTGWITDNFTAPTAGDYTITFGVTNANDTAYDSGLAVASATATAPGPIPGAGLGGLVALLCGGLFARKRGLLAR
jgi:hypothetical protein